MSTMTTPTPTTTKKTPSSPAQKESATAPAGVPTTESVCDRIRTRAHEVYQTRNGKGGAGDAASDWIQAERELNGSAPDPTASSDIEIKAKARGDCLLAGGK